MKGILPITALAALSLLAAAPVRAQGCPPAPDIEAGLDALLSEMQSAGDQRAAQAISARMWALWAKAPDARAQDLLDEGMARRSVSDLEGAVTAFDALVAYCPDYAEGYNQRAFANFIRKDFPAALADLDRAIALSPRHVPAISGRGLTLIGMGRIREGQEAIRAALALNPWLGEAQFLALEPETTDL